MAAYGNLLNLEKEVKKKKESKENPSKKSKEMEKKVIKRAKSRSRSPTHYKRKKPTSVKEAEVDWDIPDRQYGDLYCKPCDSHMNSDQMWEAHIRGKRHLKTVKKGETAEIKFEYVKEDPTMINLLEEETRPIVGLQHIAEIQRLEQRPTYQCFLCSGNVPTPQALIEHILGTKHRLAYLKEHDPERHTLIQASNLKKGHIEPVVEECIAKHEKDKGRGKMVVKRELPGSENERAYNSDYRYSRTPKAKNYSLPPSKAKSLKNNVFDGPSVSSNRSSRSKDWDCGRSTHSDRSYEGYPDDSGRRQLKDKDFDYYRKSPDRYSRSGYPERHSPDLLSSDNDYRKRMEKERLVEERYSYQRYSPERVPYGWLSASEADRFSIPHGTDVPFHRPRSAVDDNCGDLREVLDKKKTSVDPYLDQYSNTSSIARGTNEISNQCLQMIDELSATKFLQLAYFKIGRLSINTESELKLLDKLCSKITTLSMQIKANQLPTNLQDEFKETMVKSGCVNPPFQNMEQILEMVGQVKASSNAGGRSSTIQYPDTSKSAYSTPTYASSDLRSTSGVQPPSYRDYNAPATNQTSWKYVNSNLSSTSNNDLNSKNSWPHANSNASSTANSAMFGSSSASYIPGLDNQPNDTAPLYSSPFEVMSHITKDILGGVRSNTDTHRF